MKWNNTIDVFKCYPIPSSDNLFIENAELNSHLKICDMSGKVEKYILIDKSNITITIKDLLPGVYFLQNDKGFTLKIVKI
jgi:hypothetical protein